MVGHHPKPHSRMEDDHKWTQRMEGHLPHTSLMEPLLGHGKGWRHVREESARSYHPLRYFSRLAIDPKWIPEPKWGLGRPKNQSAQNHFKMDVCTGHVITNPMQLERAQTYTVCERYRGLFVLSNMQKLMTVQSIQCWRSRWMYKWRGSELES